MEKLTSHITDHKKCYRKITDEQVMLIRREYDRGKTTYRKLSTKYRVNESTITRILNNRYLPGEAI